MYKKPRNHSLFPKQLSQGGGSSVASIMQQRGFANPAVLLYWERAVGDIAMAQHCFPVKITKQQAAYSVLVVKVHPAYSTLFAHQSDAILQRLTTLIGHRPAQRIVIVQ